MQVDVYGFYHSPWVQAVLLGLHDRGIDHSITALPPLASFMSDGISMPAASIDGEPWQLESVDILQSVGCDDISAEELQHIESAWRGVLHRADNIGSFWGGFSLSGDQDLNPFVRLLKNYLRSFVALYFYLLIRTINLVANPKDPENYGDQFVYFDKRLSASNDPYLGGAAPDTLDYLLFGIIQCHCSIYVPPVTALQTDERLTALRAWISRMQQRFEQYPYLYSGLYFPPHKQPPTPDSAINRLAFWLGGISMVALFYITVPLIIFLAIRRRSG